MAELRELTQEEWKLSDEVEEYTPEGHEQARHNFEESVKDNQEFQSFRRKLRKSFATTFLGFSEEAWEALEGGHRGVFPGNNTTH